MPLEKPLFQHQNLSGRVFKGQHLAGVDFSYADLRGANFSSADLAGANFTGVQAGLQHRWKLLLTIAASLLSGLAGFTSVSAGFWIAYGLTIDAPRLVTSLIFFFSILVIFLLTNAVKGLLSAVGTVPIAVAIAIPVAGIVTTAGSGHPTAGGSGAQIAAIAIAAIVVAAVAATGAAIAAGLGATAVTVATSIGGMFFAIEDGQAGGAAALLDPTAKILPIQVWVGIKMGLVVGMTVTLLSLYIVWRALATDRRYTFVADFAIAFATIGGTRFRGANLTDANFSEALLKNTDFRRATITRTFWHRSKHLHWASAGNTILVNPAVRRLLVTGNGEQQSYANADLQGANLVGANLSHACLSGANLSEATFQWASLEWANLTQAQAVGTDFSKAQLTGVCGLGTWNIDSTTNLEAVDCRWVYLLDMPKPGTDDRERRPSSGEFASGEFTSLFREVLDTVDLIFRNGIDWRALTQSFQRVQVENKGATLEIQSIENKGNGLVVVKVKAPLGANKSIIHSQFKQFYDETIALFAQQHQQLANHEQEIQSIRSVMERIVTRAATDDVVMLTVGKGDFQTGFPVTLQIFQNGGALPIAQSMGELPANLQISRYYRNWQLAYRRSLKATRLDVPIQVTNISNDEFFSDCLEAAQKLTWEMNRWLVSESFRAIEREMQIRLNCHQPIRVLLQAEPLQLRQLPWHTWQFFEHYPHAEISLSKHCYRSPALATVARTAPASPVQILSILGDSRGLELKNDQAALANLNAEITFLIEPQRQALSDQLWDQRWDILFFAGHSSSQDDGTTGSIGINSREQLPMATLKEALAKAITRGLKLAIFNSCDGLGLANALADLQIPQMIVMREAVPDQVAQAFLINFLIRFADGQPLYQAVREARERLQGMETQYPCASWLPVIIQNPSEVPPTWQTLRSNL